MPRHNGLFHDLVKPVPWDAFDRLVGEHGADRRIRRLRTKDQFIALLYGQFSGATSPREIGGGGEEPFGAASYPIDSAGIGLSGMGAEPGTFLGRGARRQGPCDLRRGRGRGPADPCRRHGGAGRRHRRSEGDADRGRRELRLRPRP